MLQKGEKSSSSARAALSRLHGVLFAFLFFSTIAGFFFQGKKREPDSNSIPAADLLFFCLSLSLDVKPQKILHHHHNDVNIDDA